MFWVVDIWQFYDDKVVVGIQRNIRLGNVQFINMFFEEFKGQVYCFVCFGVNYMNYFIVIGFVVDFIMKGFVVGEDWSEFFIVFYFVLCVEEQRNKVGLFGFLCLRCLV